MTSFGGTMAEFVTLFLADPAALIGALFAPIIIGALILGTIAWFAGFGATYWAVAGWRAHRARRLEAARLRRVEIRPAMTMLLPCRMNSQFGPCARQMADNTKDKETGV